MEGFGRLFAEAVEHVRQTPAAPPISRNPVTRIDTEEKLGAWLAARGLTQVAATRFPLRIPLDATLAWQVVLGSGFRGMLTDLEEPAVEQARATFERLLHEREMTELDATSLIGAGTRP